MVVVEAEVKETIMMVHTATLVLVVQVVVVQTAEMQQMVQVLVEWDISMVGGADGTVEMEDVAPFLGVGFSNAFTGRRLNFSLLVGVMATGSPELIFISYFLTFTVMFYTG